MELQPLLARLHETLQKRVGYRLTKDVAQMLHIQLRQILVDAVQQASQERPYLMEAGSLRKLGADIPAHIPDDAFVPCMKPKVEAGDGNKPDSLRLHIELSHFLPAAVAVEDAEPSSTAG